MDNRCRDTEGKKTDSLVYAASDGHTKTMGIICTKSYWMKSWFQKPLLVMAMNFTQHQHSNYSMAGSTA